MPDLKLTIFVSSPGDVHDERACTGAVIEHLQREVRNHVRLEAYFWEDEPLQAGDDFQTQIILPSATDIAVFILWARLGTPLKRPDGSYPTGTEFEFEDAFNSHQQRGTPDLLVYRKTARALAELDDDTKVRQMLEQKKALDVFCDRWLGNPDDSFKAAFHTFQTLDEFGRRLEIHLRKLIREKVAKRSGRLADEEIRWPESKGSPYRGLEPFELEHAPVFYGRGQAIDEIVSTLQNQAASGCAFVLIFGMSGCGKSSVVRAGVLPRLAQAGVVPETGLLRRCVFRPSDAAGDLFEGLAQALFAGTAVPELEAGGYTKIDLAEALRDGPRHAIGPLRMALHRAAEAAVRQKGPDEPPEPRLILVLDQLEELFTLEKVGLREQSGFIDALSALAKSGVVWVLATMRSDFYPRCAEIRELDALKKGQGQYDLLPPSFAEIGQMIRLPARDAGLHFEQDLATKQWLDDLLHESAAKDPESLPLLEFTLERLYQTRTPDRMLTLASYSALGGLEGALAQHAEEVFAGLPLPVQAALPSLLPALVTTAPGEKGIPTSRRVAVQALASSPERQALLDALIRARLLVADRTDDGEAVVGFVHEALLRHWERLRDWIEADRDFLRVRTGVADASARWRQEGRSVDFLLPEGKPLVEARDLLAKRRADLDAEAVEFVESSLKHWHRERRRRMRIALSVAAAFVVVSSTFGVCSFLLRQRALRALAAETRAKQEAQNNFAKARETVNDYLTLVSENAELRRDLPGLHKFRAALLRKALDYYQQFLKQHADDPRLRTDVGDAYFRVAEVTNDIGSKQDARKAFDQARTFYDALSRANPGDTKLKDTLARIYNNLANVQIATGMLGEAEASYNRSIEIKQSLVSNSREAATHDSQLAQTYNNLGILQSTTGRLAESEKSYMQARQIQERLLAEHPDLRGIGLFLARTLNNLGNLQRATGRAAEAERTFQEALGIREKLVAQDPADTQSQNDLAGVYTNLAVAQNTMGRPQNAAVSLTRARQIREKLVADNPGVTQFQNDLAGTYYNLGHAQTMTAHPAEA
jgi:eukaryotic-like serine/threonine-protein kinase